MDISPSKSTSTDSEVSEDSFFGFDGMGLLSMGKIVSIEGNIGGGKTTLLSHMKLALKDNKNVIFLKEPVDDWETIKDKEGCTMLQKFYGDQAKYSFPFQMMAFISRLVLLRTAAKENPHAILVTERSLYTDKMVFAKMLFESGKMEDVNYQIYLKWFEAFACESPVTQIVYVRTDPEKCHHRIMKRCRMGEDGIPQEYLNECHRYHEAMLDTESKDCVCTDQLRIDGNVDIFDCPDALTNMIESVKKYIGVSGSDC